MKTTELLRQDSAKQLDNGGPKPRTKKDKTIDSLYKAQKAARKDYSPIDLYAHKPVKVMATQPREPKVAMPLPDSHIERLLTARTAIQCKLRMLPCDQTFEQQRAHAALANIDALLAGPKDTLAQRLRTQAGPQGLRAHMDKKLAMTLEALNQITEQVMYHAAPPKALTDKMFALRCDYVALMQTKERLGDLSL